jgi:hypothetical protein
MKRKFVVTFEGEAEIELDDEVINVVDDQWRSQLYDLKTPEEIAGHIGYNLVINQWNLSNLDGWADQPNHNARVISETDWEVSAKEVTTKIE